MLMDVKGRGGTFARRFLPEERYHAAVFIRLRDDTQTEWICNRTRSRFANRITIHLSLRRSHLDEQTDLQSVRCPHLNPTFTRFSIPRGSIRPGVSRVRHAATTSRINIVNRERRRNCREIAPFHNFNFTNIRNASINLTRAFLGRRGAFRGNSTSLRGHVCFTRVIAKL